jgi:hypothetical protein
MTREKPIIFSPPMVKALLNTKPGAWPAKGIDPSKPCKWQTRRVITRIGGFGFVTEFGESTTPGYKYHFRDKHLRWNDVREIEPPWLPGDILWVREKWHVSAIGCGGGQDTVIIAYAAGGESKMMDVSPERALYFSGKGRGRSPLFMPREAARITLEVKSVRIERLRDITEDDARAEGVTITDYRILDSKTAFVLLWDSLNAKRGYGWESNPWVWVYEFMRLT